MGPVEGRGFDVVTGAFGYTGKKIAERLLATGRLVETLTGHPERQNPFGDRVRVAPYDFEDRGALRGHLAGATTLYNTYWVRFPHGEESFDRAVRNTETMVAVAKDAGVRRIVHVSITNPSEDSPYPYFRGKARVERTIRESGLSHAIIRPTVIYGAGDILINNIAYLLRRLPVFGIPGSGSYRVRPVHVEDVADLCVQAGRRDENEIIDAVGPETFTFEEMVRLIAAKVGSRARIVHVPPALALIAAKLVGRVVGDVMLTRDELAGLMANLVVTDGPPTGHRRLSDWLSENSGAVGRTYASELARHYR
ncbi:MAG: NAD(P)H-binding protein [Actinobacteria bacterium]|nr:NAD(P)H-binding protein [Actinomycetota bacterium]